MEITKATDWQRVRPAIENKLSHSPVNPDLRKMLKNIDAMVSALSKQEVVARHNTDHYTIREELVKVNAAIKHLDQLIFMNQFM